MKSLAEEFHRIHDRARPILGTFLYGLVASLAAVAFQLAINWLHILWFKNPAATGGWHFLWISFAVMTTSSLIVGWLLHYCASRSGQRHPAGEACILERFWARATSDCCS
jgi:CIC family chloride channel protein